MGRNQQRRILHKITMALLRAEQGDVTPDEALELQKDAKVMFDFILLVYQQKKGAGALWLDRKLKDINWLEGLHEQALEARRMQPTEG